MDESTTIDVTSVPELERLTDEVRASGTPRILRRDGEVLALLVPYPRAKGRRPKTDADRAAFLASAGGWKDIVDTDKLIEDIYESRRRSVRPPVDL